MTTLYFAQVLCLFLEPKVEDFLAPTRHEMLPQYFAFLEPKLEDFLSFTTYEILTIFLPFLEPKLEDFPLLQSGPSMMS